VGLQNQIVLFASWVHLCIFIDPNLNWLWVLAYCVDDELVCVLEVGDNLIVNVEDGNSKGVFFYLILYTKSLHKVQRALIDHSGNSFNEGDDVVAWLYYQKWGSSDSSYVLLKYSHVVYVYFHLVRAIKFLMPPKNHRVSGNDVMYELLKDVLQNINEVIIFLEVDDSMMDLLKPLIKLTFLDLCYKSICI